MCSPVAAPAWTSRIGSVAPAVARTLSCGIEIPCARRNSELQAPPAINTLDVATSLFGDDTTDAAGRDLEQACRAAQRRSDLHEVGKVFHLLVETGKIGHAGLAKADILAARFGQQLPRTASFDGDRQFVGVAALLADPTPVAGGSLGGDAALLTEIF
jgi:hypothetical protein